MNQYRVLIWDNECPYSEHAVYYGDVSCLTDADVVRFIEFARVSDVMGRAVAYGALHWYRDAPDDIGRFVRSVGIKPYELAREDVEGWAARVAAEMRKSVKRADLSWVERYEARREELLRERP